MHALGTAADVMSWKSDSARLRGGNEDEDPDCAATADAIQSMGIIVLESTGSLTVHRELDVVVVWFLRSRSPMAPFRTAND